MKRVIALMAVVIFALTVGMAFAEEAAKPEAPKKAPTKYSTVKGEVTAVDPAANSIIIKSKRQEVELSVTDKTKVMINKERKSLADVKVGDTATARYKKDQDKNVATSINVTPKGAPAAPAKR